MRATKLVRKIKHLSYSERLRKLKLPTLKFRRVRGDMIEVYKVVSGTYDEAANLELEFNKYSATRGNGFKLYKGQVKYDLRKYFFTNRIVDVWNSLPENVVSADSVNSFKNRLDRYWIDQSVYYDWESDIQCRSRKP